MWWMVGSFCLQDSMLLLAAGSCDWFGHAQWLIYSHVLPPTACALCNAFAHGPAPSLTMFNPVKLHTIVFFRCKQMHVHVETNAFEMHEARICHAFETCVKR